MKKKFLEEQLPAGYANLEGILKSNKGGDGFFVGDEVSTLHIGGSSIYDLHKKIRFLILLFPCSLAST